MRNENENIINLFLVSLASYHRRRSRCRRRRVIVCHFGVCFVARATELSLACRLNVRLETIWSSRWTLFEGVCDRDWPLTSLR